MFEEAMGFFLFSVAFSPVNTGRRRLARESFSSRVRTLLRGNLPRGFRPLERCSVCNYLYGQKLDRAKEDAVRVIVFVVE